MLGVSTHVCRTEDRLRRLEIQNRLLLALVLVAVLLVAVASTASAASYVQTNGTFIDPIQNTFGGDHSYSGTDLGPGVDLTSANLASADLTNAALTSAGLRGVNLRGPNRRGPEVRGPD